MITSKLASVIQQRSKDRKSIIMSDPGILSHVTDLVSSGCLPLDIIMGGGYPVGRITQIFGDNSSGKTLLGLHALKCTQDSEGVAVLIDTETTAESSMVDAVELNRDELIYLNPNTIEEVCDHIMDILSAVETSAPDVLVTIVWDSIAATSSDAEMEVFKKEGLKKAAAMATHARLLSQMFRVMPRLIADRHICLICINQMRAKIGVMYGEKESPFGGNALKYYSTVMLKLDALTSPFSAENRSIKPNAPTIERVDIRAFVYKNKIAAPFGWCDIPVIFGKGMDEAGSILWWLKNHPLNRREEKCFESGTWSKLILETGEVIKFQSSSWPKIYAEHEQEIKELVAHSAGFTEEES